MCEVKLCHKFVAVMLKAKYMLIPICVFVSMMCGSDRCDVCREIFL